MSTRALKILVIGGSGFMSGTLAQVAVEQGHQVWTLTRGQRPVPPDVVSLVADRHNSQAFVDAINLAGTNWDLVVDCIAYHPDDIRQDLAVLSARTHHLVMISTDFVYDPVHRQFPQPEVTDYYLKEGYGGLKRQSEKVLLDAPAGDLNWTILRPGHIYGPGSELGCLPAHGRDPQLIDRLKNGESLQLVGGGYFLQQPVLARDLANTALSLFHNPTVFSQIFNVAGPDVVESREYYQIIAEYLGVSLRVEELPVEKYRLEHPDAASFLCHRFYDLQKLRESGASVPATPLKAGLRAHIEQKMQELAEMEF